MPCATSWPACRRRRNSSRTGLRPSEFAARSLPPTRSIITAMGGSRLNLIAPPGAQAAFTKMQPEAYFVPPYVGPRGWLGVELDKGLGWETIREHVRDAYEMVAPAELVNAIEKNFRVKPPTRKFRPEEIDPFKGKAAKDVLKKLEAICAALPETEPGTQFGVAGLESRKEDVRQHALLHGPAEAVVLGWSRASGEAD